MKTDQLNLSDWNEAMDEKFHQDLIEIYGKDPRRNKSRLHKELKVPKQYLSIFEEAMNHNSQIYFSGLNQYALRKILTSAMSLEELKSLFLNSLKHAKQQSSDVSHFNYHSK